MTPDPKPKRKYKKKTERQKLDADCLELWSKCVRMTDKTCRNCNSDFNLNAHHIVQRNYKASRYLLSNGLTLCAGCHFSEHVDPEKFRSMVIGIIGEQKYLSMQETYRIQYKYTLDDLRTIKNNLTVELKRLEAE
jgi:5-methylcytosine-specific restriction endonuclease McrA